MQHSYDCRSFKYDFHENIPLSIVFGICFIIGLPLIFVGYRFFRTSLFLQAFSLISIITYSLLTELTGVTVYFNGVISAGSGILFGIASVLLYTIGYILASIIQAIFITVCVLYAVNLFVFVDNFYIPLCIGATCWVVLFIINIRWQRAVSLLYITSYGVILLMLSIDYYLNLSLLRIAAYRHLLTRELTTLPCWFSWILLGLWPILLFLGGLVQFLKTAQKYDHRKERRLCSRSKEPQVRLLSDQSDRIATPWMNTPTSPRSQKSLNHIGDDEVFLMEDTTPV